MVVNCDKNNHQIRFWLVNNYKIKLMIKVSDQLSQLVSNIKYKDFSHL